MRFSPTFFLILSSISSTNTTTTSSSYSYSYSSLHSFSLCSVFSSSSSSSFLFSRVPVRASSLLPWVNGKADVCILSLKFGGLDDLVLWLEWAVGVWSTAW